MSNMKDYAMWLDDRGIATWCTAIGELIIPSGINVYESSIVTEYKNDADWHHAEPDESVLTDEDDFIIEDDDDGVIIDDGDLDDCAYTPDEYWFNPDGGLTGDAYNFLAKTDSQGDFV